MACYAQHAEAFLAPTSLHPQHGEAHMESSPVGVLFCIEPWNFPCYQLARVAGPQLMAGNVLVVKHAGCVPQCAIAFERLLLDAGAPVGAYTNRLFSHEQCDRVIDDPRLKGVALTGSDAFIVLASIADEFTTRFKAALVQLLAQVDAAVKGGATLLMGASASRVPAPSCRRPSSPTSCPATRPSATSSLARWCRSTVSRTKRAASLIDTGMVFVNNIDWADANLPFGGIKNSGYGRELGNLGIQEFVNKKLVRTGRTAAPV